MIKKNSYIHSQEFASDSRPIGVFDSGIGGLTVLKEIWKELPQESTVYFGDNGRTPYGTKSHDTIVTYSVQNMRFLLSQNVKMIVIACNTASAHAFSEVKALSCVPVVEVITPGADQAARRTKSGRIGIIATRATVESGIYRTAVETAANELLARGINRTALENLFIDQASCPLFVSLAEEGFWNHEIVRLAAEEYLHVLREEKVDTLILGCTHYPLLSNMIAKVMGEETMLINAGSSVAAKVRQVLMDNHLLNTSGSPATLAFYTSDDPTNFENIATPFLGGGRPSGTKRVMTEDYDSAHGRRGMEL